MPLYEFVCDCGQEAEKITKMDTEFIECPLCGGIMKKKISISSFHLKGHNWYKDHYGLKSSKKEKQ